MSHNLNKTSWEVTFLLAVTDLWRHLRENERARLAFLLAVRAELGGGPILKNLNPEGEELSQLIFADLQRLTAGRAGEILRYIEHLVEGQPDICVDVEPRTGEKNEAAA